MAGRHEAPTPGRTLQLLSWSGKVAPAKIAGAKVNLLDSLINRNSSNAKHRVTQASRRKTKETRERRVVRLHFSAKAAKITKCYYRTARRE